MLVSDLNQPQRVNKRSKKQTSNWLESFWKEDKVSQLRWKHERLCITNLKNHQYKICVEIASSHTGESTLEAAFVSY